MDKLIYTGKAKQMWQTADPNVLKVVYTNQATALNGKKKDQIRDKGELNNQISTLVFDYLIANGIPTHFIKKLNDTEELVKKCQMIRLEFVTRNVCAGHFASRFGMEEGRVFDQPVEELFYKSDELGDPFLNNSGAQGLGFATADDLQACWHLSERVNTLLTILFRRAGMQLVDFKLEFGKLPDGHIVLADEFSPDNCRLWDLKTRQHMDKDVFRRNLGDLTVTYEEVLHRLQKALGKEN